ncbi:synaptotagmin-5-like [Limulus polyphemus]|uniref:Synaptotagmin-5-like n=1 Tax=Limulus polyphemus TaxID=6850 RepID=A0ABM1SLG2_LIMPO|nr:synaptotagmin-5-like [Limulus polyphemus]
MVAIRSSNVVSSGYYTAVYVCVSFLVVMLICLLFYVLCSRRYKLNWFERSSLIAAEETRRIMSLETTEEKEIGNVLKMTRKSRGIFLSSRSSGRLENPLKQDSSEFWVPQSLQKQLIVGDKDCDLREKSLPESPNTPVGIKVSPFTLAQTGPVSMEKGIPTLFKYAQSPVAPKVTSMYSKLDHKKIDATMYLEGINGTADPYAKVRLLSDPENFRLSSVHHKTLNPSFKEDFVFIIPEDELQQQTIEALLYDYDQYSRHTCLGRVRVSLQNLDLTEKVTLLERITQCEEEDEKPDLGDLMLSLGYLPSAERLTVAILKARNLQPRDDTKKFSDPYVKVVLVQDGKRFKEKKTSIERGTLNPVFNEALTFNVAEDQLKNLTLVITVMNDSILDQNEILGRVVIGPKSKGKEAAHMRDMLFTKRSVTMWHTLIGATLPIEVRTY